MQKHDAKSGFHDIKPPEEIITSNSLPENLALYLAAALGLMLLFFIIKQLINKRTKIKKENAIKDFQINIENLFKEHQSQNISLKDYSENSSMLIRKLVCNMTKFPAEERTEKELNLSFNDFLKTKYKNANINKLNKASELFLSTINKASYQVYSKDSLVTFESKNKIAELVKENSLKFSNELKNLELSEVKKK